MGQSNNSFSTAAEVLQKRHTQCGKSTIHYEFQYYGNYLAEKLDDQQHATLYMKLAKETDRALLERALEFVLGSKSVKNRARMFMWVLKRLR